MTYNEKKDFLEQYRYHIRRIKQLHRELEEWHTIGTNITQKLSPVTVKGSGNKSKVEECALRLASIEDMIANELQAAEDSRDLIENSICSIKDTRKREIIEMRYVKGMAVSSIANELHRDTNNVYRTIRLTIRNMDI